MITKQIFEPTLESVRQHKVPDWYHDAKLGIFIHWGLYSVPGWAPLSGDISKAEKNRGWESWFKNNSYAEWYLNSLKFEDSLTRRFHHETYGADFSYDDFAPRFNEAIQRWNPDEWANLFQKIGARYVVLTSKHHDGFNLWTTNYPCPHKNKYQSSRDIVGELTTSVRKYGMKMGLYYSGGLDWSFNETRINNLEDVWNTIVQEPQFVNYSVSHWRELIQRYQPSLMWNDIGFPKATNLSELFAFYYNTVPDGVINDRFSQTGIKNTDRTGQPDDVPQGPHYDFVTPEYSSFHEIRAEKWEAVRGIGHSFGYNQQETDDQLLSLTELIHLFVDVASKNGNLLLNVGPTADGTIPQNQRKRLESFGQWLGINGEAIFGTRPWTRAEGNTVNDIPVRFTKKDNSIYTILLDTPVNHQVTVEGLSVHSNTKIQLLGFTDTLEWQQHDGNLTVMLPEQLPDFPAYSLKLSNIQ